MAAGVHPWLANFVTGYGVGRTIGADWRAAQDRADAEALKQTYWDATRAVDTGEPPPATPVAPPPAATPDEFTMEQAPAAAPAAAPAPTAPASAPAAKEPQFQEMTWKKFKNFEQSVRNTAAERNLDPGVANAAIGAARGQLQQQAVRYLGQARMLMNSGDYPGAAEAMTRVSQSMPDGRKRIFVPTENGVTETIVAADTGEQLAKPTSISLDTIDKLYKAATGVQGLQIFGSYTQAAADEIQKRDQESQKRVNELTWYTADQLLKANQSLALVDAYANRVGANAKEYGWKSASDFHTAAGKFEDFVAEQAAGGYWDVGFDDPQSKMNHVNNVQMYGSNFLRANPDLTNAWMVPATEEFLALQKNPEELAKRIELSDQSPTGRVIRLMGGRVFNMPAEFLLASGIPVSAPGASTGRRAQAPDPMGTYYTLPNGFTVYLAYMTDGEIKQLDKAMRGTGPAVPTAKQSGSGAIDTGTPKEKPKEAPKEAPKKEGGQLTTMGEATGGWFDKVIKTMGDAVRPPYPPQQASEAISRLLPEPGNTRWLEAPSTRSDLGGVRARGMDSSSAVSPATAPPAAAIPTSAAPAAPPAWLGNQTPAAPQNAAWTQPMPGGMGPNWTELPPGYQVNAPSRATLPPTGYQTPPANLRSLSTFDLQAIRDKANRMGAGVVADASGNVLMRDASGNTVPVDASGNMLMRDASGNTVPVDASGNIVPPAAPQRRGPPKINPPVWHGGRSAAAPPPAPRYQTGYQTPPARMQGPQTYDMGTMRPQAQAIPPGYQTPPARMQGPQTYDIGGAPRTALVAPDDPTAALARKTEESRVLSGLITQYQRLVDAGQMNQRYATVLLDRIRGMRSLPAQAFAQELQRYFPATAAR